LTRRTVADDGVAVLTTTPDPAPIGMLLGDLVRARGLITMLARKEFYVRYRRASFGLLWAVLLPLTQALVLAAVISQVTNIRTPGIPFGLFTFAGMLVWGFFSTGLTSGATAIVDGAGLSTKIYFPRAVLPLVTVIAGLYGFVLSVVVLVGMCVVYGVELGWRLLLLVPGVLLAIGLTCAVSLVLAPLHVYARDLRFVLEATQRAWFYVTPVFYPIAKAGRFRPWIEANPATGMVELFRAATVGADAGWLRSLWWSLGWLVGLTVVAAVLHRRRDRVFVDLL
jgi:ABC-type polysaccharide/polyol phosphate export permease